MAKVTCVVDCGHGNRPGTMTLPEQATTAAERTAWGRHLQTTLRQFLRTETGSAAAELKLNTERFARDLRKHAYAARVAEDVDTADLGAVSGTPTFFVNGQRHHGAYDVGSLSQAVRTARAVVAVAR